MRPRPVSPFRIAKAIIGSCETESKLRDTILFLKSPEHLKRVVQALETLVSQDRFPTVKPSGLDGKEMQAEKISALVTHLRNENFTAAHVERLIAEIFHARIPSNKVGLDKYIRRVARHEVFEKVYRYFLLERGRKPAPEDPWLREMLVEQEKRANEPK